MKTTHKEAKTVQFDSLAERLDEKNLPGEFPAECLSYTQPREGGTAPHRHDCMEIGLCVEGGAGAAEQMEVHFCRYGGAGDRRFGGQRISHVRRTDAGFV